MSENLTPWEKDAERWKPVLVGGLLCGFTNGDGESMSIPTMMVLLAKHGLKIVTNSGEKP